MSEITIVNCESGAVEVRRMTAEELAQRELDAAAAAEAAAAAAAAAAAQASAAEAAIAHAKSLGFTDEMIAAMYPNLVAS